MFQVPHSVPEMDKLDIDALIKIQEMAAGMTKEEILTTFQMKWDDFDMDERCYFDEFYYYGRGEAVNYVIQNLLEQTKGKAGVQPALAFLRRFANEFEGEESASADGNFNFSFTK